MESEATADALRVYWQPGCSSCLRVKEYLEAQGVAYVSRNVLADPLAFEELQRLGLRQVPIVTRGGRYANGQVLADVARLAGLGVPPAKLLPPDLLGERLQATLAISASGLRQFPEQLLGRQFLDRPRTVADLIFHIFNVADALVELHEGLPLSYASYNRVPAPTPEGSALRGELIVYGSSVSARIQAFFSRPHNAAEWASRADVYYGVQTLHQFLERTTWHCLQHSRQLLSLLSDAGVEPVVPMDDQMLQGLPLPNKVWDADQVRKVR